MKVLREIPFFFIVLFLIIGIVGARLCTFDTQIVYLVFFAFILVSIPIFLRTVREKTFFILLIGSLIFISLGFVLFKSLEYEINDELLQIESTNEIVSVRASVLKIVPYEDYKKVVFTVESVWVGDTLINVDRYNSYAYLPSDFPLLEGELVSFDGCMNGIVNKYGVDFRSINYLKRIYSNFYIIQSSMIVKSQFSLKTISYKCKNHVSTIFEKYIEKINIVQILNGMFLGVKSKMSKDNLSDFQRVGVMHVFTVSGLHVGLVFLVLFRVLGFVQKVLPIKAYFIWLILFFGIWSFVLLTGAQTSVTRSALMLTFIMTGQILKKSINVYNVLSASAFVLLVIDPLYLFQVGFQLSYAAVFGIFYLYKPIYDLKVFTNGFINKVWQLFVVNISAWLFTLPFLLYYFHSFSTLSVLTGILIIPLVSLTMVFILVLIICHLLMPVVAIYIGKLIEIIVELIISIAHLFSKIEVIFLDNIEKDSIWVFLYLTVLLLIGAYFKTAQKKWLYSFSVSFFIWLSYDLLMMLI